MLVLPAGRGNGQPGDQAGSCSLHHVHSQSMSPTCTVPTQVQTSALQAAPCTFHDLSCMQATTSAWQHWGQPTYMPHLGRGVLRGMQDQRCDLRCLHRC